MTNNTLPRAGITRVFSATCSECEYHESLHSTSRQEAERTARELGWLMLSSGLVCPSCTPRKPRRKGARA